MEGTWKLLLFVKEKIVVEFTPFPLLSPPSPQLRGLKKMNPTQQFEIPRPYDKISTTPQTQIIPKTPPHDETN